MTIFERVRALNLPRGEYVVVGGAMEAHGIRPARDVDIVATTKLFEELQKQGWTLCACEKCSTSEWRKGTKRILKREDVEVLSEYSCGDAYRADTIELIANADIIEGIPFMQLTELVKWKRAMGREKDVRDVALIEAYLASQGK